MAVRPLRFTCETRIAMSATEICERIARVESWPEFGGYGVIPGIASAHYEHRAEGMVGSRIRVRNRDGSTHREEIHEWSPRTRVEMQMREFSQPLQSLATHFVEEWIFSERSPGTLVQRTFTLHPRSHLTWPPLLVVSLLLKRAVARHVQQMRAMSES